MVARWARYPVGPQNNSETLIIWNYKPAIGQTGETPNSFLRQEVPANMPISRLNFNVGEIMYKFLLTNAS
jgi:hypothetical protein